MVINFLGDSITAGAGAVTVANMYTTRLCAMLGAVENNYGICGTRIAKQRVHRNPDDLSEDEDFLVRAEKMATNADFVFVFGGTNDYGHGDATMGSLGSTDCYTFYGALDALCRYLLGVYGREKLCFILPLPRFDSANIYGESGAKKSPSQPLSAYIEAERAVLTSFDIDFLDLSDDFPTPLTSSGDELTMDGLHPNPKGHKIIADRLYTYLRQKGF